MPVVVCCEAEEDRKRSAVREGNWEDIQAARSAAFFVSQHHSPNTLRVQDVMDILLNARFPVDTLTSGCGSACLPSMRLN